MTTEIIVERKSHSQSSQTTEPSTDDPNRKELPWEKREENLLISWCDDCKSRSKAHDVKGKRHKLQYAVFGVPSVLIPIMLGGVASVVPCQSIIYSVSMMLSGLFSGVSMFFNFGKKQQHHLNFSSQYFELSNDIECELSKPKRHRTACDVYMEGVKIKYNNMCRQAPDL
tara:strand:+ start:3008 stop:3517 length:510 start_codon:yes stop_codon:yes gene_type:complete